MNESVMKEILSVWIKSCNYALTRRIVPQEKGFFPSPVRSVFIFLLKITRKVVHLVTTARVVSFSGAGNTDNSTQLRFDAFAKKLNE